MGARRVGFDPLDGDADHWSIVADGPESNRLRARLGSREGLGDEAWDEILLTAWQILWQCPDPGGEPRQVTGLALGKVQSGKTLSYTALIALAMDNGYSVTVVLAGTKNPLLQQTYNRLCDDLDATRLTLVPFRNPRPEEFDTVHSVLIAGNRILIVALKHRLHIENLERLLGSPELRQRAVLIIDDEGDEASLNTQFRSAGRSAIYDRILRLRRALPLHAYVAYTATPQANLLISGIDGLSPDFGVLVAPGAGYCGGSVFFGERMDEYVLPIPDDEGGPERAAQITESLERAILTFLVGGAIRSLRGQSEAWHSILVHTSRLRSDHERLHAAVRGLCQLWKQTLTLPREDPALAALLTRARAAYENLTRTLQNPPEWPAVESRLSAEILFDVWMVNSLRLGRDPVGTRFKLKNNVLIGGNMLGRGVTIPGLAVTYITRQAADETNADTLEQRARWFGYKRDYLGVCRIFITERLRDRYAELLVHEDDFWEALRRNERQGLPIRLWPRMFRLDTSTWQLRPTRPSVADYRQFRGQGWDVQGQISRDAVAATHNAAVVADFFRRYPGAALQVGPVRHRVVFDCPLEDVIGALLAPMDMAGTDFEKEYIEEYLSRLLVGGVLRTMDVVLMRDGKPRKRKPDRRGRINPMQGHTPGKTQADHRYYPGDREIHGGKAQLQVHILQVRDLAGVLPIALAVYVPPDARYDLRLIVREESRL